MIRPRLDKWSDYSKLLSIKREGPFAFIFSNIGFIFPKTMFILCMWFLFICAAIEIQTLYFFFPLLVIYYYNYFTLRKLGHGLKVKREYNSHSIEDRSEILKYNISNPYSFEYSNLIINDYFQGYQTKNLTTQYAFYFSRFFPHRRLKLEKKIEMNNGMGKKVFGPMTMMLTDAIGLHRLSFEEITASHIDVYPRVMRSNAPKVHANYHSSEFGIYDSLLRGESVNFYRTREYIPGDSVKRINWKLSLKSQHLIVNEFEDNSNALIDIIFINDNRLHVGEGRKSTFEYSRDLALSLCYEHIKSNNSIGLQTHSQFIPPKSGKKHLTAMELMIAGMKLEVFNSSELYHRGGSLSSEVILFNKKIQRNTRPVNNTYIITSIVPGKLWKHYLKLIEDVSRKSRGLHLIVVTGVNELFSNVSEGDKLWVKTILEQLPSELEYLKKFCKDKNIILSIVDIHDQFEYKRRVRDAFKRV